MKTTFALALAGLLAGSCVTQQTTLPPVRDPEPPMILDRLGDYRRDVATDSEAARRWFDQGMALMLGYNFDGAIASFRQATAIDPGFAMAWRRLGVLCERTSNRARARDAYQAVIDLWAPGGRAERTVQEMRDRIESLEAG